MVRAAGVGGAVPPRVLMLGTGVGTAVPPVVLISTAAPVQY